ncbi:MAG: hypothetical protein CSB33_04485 [Desulfobacterales bacterium]|nr:MAG: hypothetical protein CSB33_04485 [Desulfobacterales bacterium]
MSSLKQTVSLAFKIRPGEGWPTSLLLLHSFFTGIALVFLETSAYALFFARFPIETLPWVYIASAVLTTAIGLCYGYMEERFSFQRLLILTTGFLLGMVFLFFLAGLFTEDIVWHRALSFSLVVWHSVTLSLTGLVFWSLAGRLLNVRQGKRLFGLIGAGEILAGVIGGLMVSWLVKKAGANGLLLFSASGLMFCLIVLVITTRKLSRRLSVVAGEEEDTGSGGDIRDLFTDRYFQLIVGTAILSVFAYFILDYVFYDRAEFRHPGEEELAAFLGRFIAIIGMVNLAGNMFLHSRLMERYGLALGLLAVPVIVLAGSAAAAAAGFSGGMAALFWLVVISKGMDEFLRGSLEEPSFRILYQPFPPGQRMKAQTLLETMVEPGANALIGILLLLMGHFADPGPAGILVIGSLILAVWTVSAWRLKKEYPRALTRALSKRRLGGAVLALGDSASLEVLLKGLKSPIAGEVINCLNMLEELHEEDFRDELVRLLEHEDPQVRRHVLDKIGRLNIAGAAGAIQSRLERETDKTVIGCALRNLCVVAEADAFEFVYTFLEDPDMDLEIKQGAMAGLLASGGIDGVLSAGSKLNILLESTRAEERKLAAQVLGEVGISSFYRPLLKLLKDDDLSVRSAAITASGKLRNPRLLPALIRNFEVVELNNVVVSGITAFGPDILPELEIAFDREDQTRTIRIKLVRIISRIGGNQAIAILKRKIDFSEEEIRSQVLSALVNCRYQADMRDIDRIQERIRNEAADAAWSLAVLVDVGEQEDVLLLSRSLQSEVNKNRDRIFHLLGMIYQTDSILQARVNLKSDSRDRQANAVEVLDNLLPQEMKTIVFPLVDEMPASQRLSRLVTLFPQKRLSRHERLKEILARSQQWTSAWTKTCALFIVGRIATKEFYDAIISCLSDPDPVVRETAVWALGRLNPDDLIQRLTPLKRDAVERVAEYARFVINSVGFARIPMGKSGFLTRSGRYTAELFLSILEDDGERRLRRCRAANILSRFRIPAARVALLGNLMISDKMVRSAVLDALIKGKFDLEESDTAPLIQLIRAEISDAGQIMESAVAFLRVRHGERLFQSLRQELSHTRRRILLALFLLYSRNGLLEVPSGKQAPEIRAPGIHMDEDQQHALHYWFIHQEENQVIPEDVVKRLDLLLGCLSADRALAEKIRLFFLHRHPDRLKDYWHIQPPADALAAEIHLKQIAFGTEIFSLSWSRICALELIVRAGMTQCIPRVVEQLSSPDDVVRATSAWALYKLHPAEYARHSQRLMNDISFLVSRTARQLRQTDAGRTGNAS